MSQILYIDGDILLHRFSITNEVSVDWDGDGEIQTFTHDESCEKQVLDFIHLLSKHTKTKEIEICFSCPVSSDNFRKEVLPTYKAHRKAEKPLLFNGLRKFLEDKFVHHSEPRLEADDLMSIFGTQDPDGSIIATIDKDLYQVPTSIYNWTKWKRYEIDADEALYFFYHQVLTGDQVDNFKGCKGIGPKKADLTLENCRDEIEMWNAVQDTYWRKGYTDEEILQQARCAYLLQDGDYNFETKEITLWEPPKE